MSVLWDLVMFLGSTVCHQLPERSFFLDGTQMPLCARCIGIHIGFVFAVASIYLGPRRYSSALPSHRQAAVLCGAMAFFLGDALLSYSGISPSNNLRRTLSGLALGIPLPFVIVPLLNSFVYDGRDLGRILREPKDWVWPASLYVLGAAAVLLSTDSSPLFHAVSVVGVFGVFLFFSFGISLVLLLALDKRGLRKGLVLAMGTGLAVVFLLTLGLAHGLLFPS